MNILFNDSALPFIFEAFELSTINGFLADKNGYFIKTDDGEKIESNRFGGYKNGSYFKDDLHSIMKFGDVV